MSINDNDKQDGVTPAAHGVTVRDMSKEAVRKMHERVRQELGLEARIVYAPLGVADEILSRFSFEGWFDQEGARRAYLGHALEETLQLRREVENHKEELEKCRAEIRGWRSQSGATVGLFVFADPSLPERTALAKLRAVSESLRAMEESGPALDGLIAQIEADGSRKH